MPVEWGDVPTWVQAVGTVGTLAAALYVVWREQQASERNDEERRREQASQVAAWAAIERKQPVAIGMTVAVFIHNASRQPVYDVVALVQDGATGDGLGTLSIGVLAPGETRRLEHAEALSRFLTDDRWTGSPAVTVSFRDSAGRAWQRDMDGHLTPQDGHSEPWQRRASARRLRRADQQAETDSPAS